MRSSAGTAPDQLPLRLRNGAELPRRGTAFHPAHALTHLLFELLSLLGREDRRDLLVRLAAVLHQLLPDRLDFRPEGIPFGGREVAIRLAAQRLAHLLAQRGVLLLHLGHDRLDLGTLVGAERETRERRAVERHRGRTTLGHLRDDGRREEAEGSDEREYDAAHAAFLRWGRENTCPGAGTLRAASSPAVSCGA